MNENTAITIDNRPREDYPCGCVHFPAFTAGHQCPCGCGEWVAGTHYEPWTDTHECREGHDFE